jgi:mutator protein MutT
VPVEEDRAVTAPIERIVVSAAVVCRDNCYLITRRLKGTHLEGLWEFPGGKCEPNETHEDCLRREIVEELGANIVVRERILSARHRYDTREVELHFFACDLAGDPHPRLGQEVRWVPRAELDRLDFPAADAELIDLLKAASSPSP